MKAFPLLCLLFSAFAFSQTTYKSDYVNINTGDPGWASFYFGNSITLVGRAFVSGSMALVTEDLDEGTSGSTPSTPCT